jgi:hypothetical protein
MDFLPALFHDKLTEDTREPFLTCVQLPGCDGCFDVYAPRLLFWIQLFYVGSRNPAMLLVGLGFPHAALRLFKKAPRCSSGIPMHLCVDHSFPHYQE